MDAELKSYGNATELTGSTGIAIKMRGGGRLIVLIGCLPKMLQK